MSTPFNDLFINVEVKEWGYIYIVFVIIIFISIFHVSPYLVFLYCKYCIIRYGGVSFGERDLAAFTGNVTEVQGYIERILTAANNGTTVSIGDREFLYDLTEVLPTLAVKDVAKVGKLFDRLLPMFFSGSWHLPYNFVYLEMNTQTSIKSIVLF